MRRFIAAVFSLAVVLGLAAFADAQFRRPVRAPQAPIRFNPFVFNNVPPFNAFTASSFVTFQTPRGAFAPAVPGAFDPRTRTFVPSATGAATLTSRGVFRPTTGTFVPAPNGNFVLTNRNIFNPTTGTFTPSATGNFVFSTRGNLVTPNGSNLPVNLRGLGLVNPLNPFSPINPINQARFAWLANYQALLTANYMTSMNPYAYGNPYAPMYGYYPAAYGSPYAATPYGYMSSGYGSSGGYGNYSSPYYPGAATSYPNVAPASYAAPQAYASIPAYAGNNEENRQNQVTLTAFGIPNENGKVTWPLAFRLMPPDLRRDLLDKLEADLQVLATQGAAGKVNPTLVREAKDSVQALQRWLTEHRVDLAVDAYREADVMLRRIEKTLRRLE